MAGIAPPAVTIGPFGTDQFVADDLIRDVERQVVQRDRESVPLMTWLTHTAGRMQQTMNEDFWHQEQQFDYVSHIMPNGLVGGAATEIQRINSAEYIAGDTIAHPDSRQYFIVDAATRFPDPTDLVYGGYSTITIRGIGGNILPVVGAMTVAPCGVALSDGSYFPDAKGIKPVQIANTVTVRSASVEVTHGADRSTTYYGSPRLNNNNMVLSRFRKDMERDLTHSNYAVMSGYVQTNGNGTRTSTIRFTRGLTNAITQNVQSYSGSANLATYKEYLRTNIYANVYYGSANKLQFNGPTFSSQLQDDLDLKTRILSGPNALAYGFQVSAFTTHEGNKIFFFAEKNFRGMSPYDKGCMILDPKFIKLRHNGPNMMEIWDTSPPRQAVRSLSVEANYGLELQFDGAHGFLKQKS